MQLNQFIQDLLYQYECVTIPRFGAFLTRSHKIKVSSAGAFSPPRKEVNFNQLLKSNDGVLAHYMARKEKITYELAMRLIEKEVSSWKKRLQTQTLRFSGVGDIMLNEHKKIIFRPWNKANFDVHSYGLATFDRQSLMYFSNNSKIIPLMEDTNKDDLMFAPEKKSPIMRYAAIGIITISLLGGSYFFSDRYVADQRLVAQQKAQIEIEKNVQEATFDLGDLNAVEVVFKAIPEESVMTSLTYYSVIAGSFRSLKNAENKVKQLINEGYSAELAESNSGGLYRAAFGRYETRKEAINMLYFLKYTLKEDAWYLEEK
jgi:hypothetical protein